VLGVNDIAVIPIPEPAALSMLLLGGLPVLARRRRRRHLTGVVEPLQRRMLLSSDGPTATMPIATDLSASSLVFTPAEIRQAYGINDISFNGTSGDGAGQTIAIVDAENDPNIIADTAYFDTYYGLQQFNVSGGPTLTVLNQDGNPTPLPANSAPGDWDVEESMDVQWAHVAAPQANVILFEANNLNTAGTSAANYPGVSVVSMSWGQPEYSGEQICDSTFTTPAGHEGVTFLAASGDGGAPGQYPAYSPNVIAVGGTLPTTDDSGNYVGESGDKWSGGGISTQENQPPYQNGIVSAFSSTRRTIPDVAMVWGSVYMADSYWLPPAYRMESESGTSLSCPIWAGLIAIANQGRALSGLGTLGSLSQTQGLSALYNLAGNTSSYSADFHDITTGNNGYTAGTGYDLVTGLGSPVANNLVPALADYPVGPHLAFGQDSSDAAPSDDISPAVTVDVEDANGNIITTDNSDVTLSIYSETGNATLQGTTTVAAVDGVATFDDLAVASAGNYTLEAEDGSYLPVASNSFSVGATATTVTSNNGATDYGQSVTFTATVTPVCGSGETGTVQFQIDGGNVGIPITLSGNTASYTTSTLSAGNNLVDAVYSGDRNFMSSTSPVCTQSVAIAASATTLSSSGPTNYGQSVTFAVTVTPASGNGETGTVQFVIDGGNAGSPIALDGNTAAYTTLLLSAGSHTVAAVYSGDSNFAGSTSPTLTQNVLPPWLDPTSAAVWNAGTQTLTVTGRATITANPAVLHDVPVIDGDGSVSHLVVNFSLVTIGGLSLANGATVDVRQNTVNMSDATLDAVSVIQGYIFGGQIFSSSVVSGSPYAVGYGPYTSGGTSYTEFRYDIRGDANLDGMVNNVDLTTVLQNLGLSTNLWSLGNFEYNPLSPSMHTTVDNSDLTDALMNLGGRLQGSGFPAWLDPASQATWDDNTQTLTVTGVAVVIADPSYFGADPIIVDAGNGDHLVVDTQLPNGSGNATVYLGGAISGSLTLFVDMAGDGTVVLGSANAYSGGTTVHAGRLQLGNNTAGYDGSIADDVTDDGEISFNLFGNQTYAGVISGNGSVTVCGNSASVLTFAGENTYSGGTTVNGGALDVAATNGLLPGSNVTNNAVLEFDGAQTLSTLSDTSGNGTAGTTIVSGSGNLTVPGMFAQAGLINYGTMELNGTGTTGRLTGSGNLTIGSGSTTNTLTLAS